MTFTAQYSVSNVNFIVESNSLTVFASVAKNLAVNVVWFNALSNANMML